MVALALFGAGRIGRIHARNAMAQTGLTLKYVVDPVAEAAQGLAAEVFSKQVLHFERESTVPPSRG